MWKRCFGSRVKPRDALKEAMINNVAGPEAVFALVHSEITHRLGLVVAKGDKSFREIIRFPDGVEPDREERERLFRPWLDGDRVPWESDRTAVEMGFLDDRAVRSRA